jgi:hypothetical protein
MPDISSEKFRHGYGSLLVMSWGNPALLKWRLNADPAKVLKEFGLDSERRRWSWGCLAPPAGRPLRRVR